MRGYSMMMIDENKYRQRWPRKMAMKRTTSAMDCSASSRRDEAWRVKNGARTCSLTCMLYVVWCGVECLTCTAYTISYMVLRPCRRFAGLCPRMSRWCMHKEKPSHESEAVRVYLTNTKPVQVSILLPNRADFANGFARRSDPCRGLG